MNYVKNGDGWLKIKMATFWQSKSEVGNVGCLRILSTKFNIKYWKTVSHLTLKNRQVCLYNDTDFFPFKILNSKFHFKNRCSVSKVSLNNNICLIYFPHISGEVKLYSVFPLYLCSATSNQIGEAQGLFWISILSSQLLEKEIPQKPLIWFRKKELVGWLIKKLVKVGNH